MGNGEISNLAKWHNVKEDDIINYVRKSNNESNENTELLTLKAMTVLFVIATIVSLYFFALYTSDELITFQEMLDNLNLGKYMYPYPYLCFCVIAI